jgi:hypothetical protein
MIPLFPPSSLPLSSPLSPFVSPYIGLLVDRDFEHLPRYRFIVLPGIDDRFLVHPVHSTPHALPHFSIVIRRRPSPKRLVRFSRPLASSVALHHQGPARRVLSTTDVFRIPMPSPPGEFIVDHCHRLLPTSSRRARGSPHSFFTSLRRRHRGRVPQAGQHICVDHPLGKHTTGPKARLKQRRRTARVLGDVAGHSQNQIGPDRTALG